MIEYEWPWQYSFSPFFTLQPHTETRSKQVAVWKSLVVDYCKANKQFTLDVRDVSDHCLFNNVTINRKLNKVFILAILSDMRRTEHAASVDKDKCRWEIYWHTLEEWGNIIYRHISDMGATNSVLTLFEIVHMEEQSEFFGIDTNILIKSLRVLEKKGKCELMLSDNEQGVKFF